MVKLKDLFLDFEQDGKRYCMTPESIENKWYSFGDSDRCIQFHVNVQDKDYNIPCMTATYTYIETDSETNIELDDYDILESYKEFMLFRTGMFQEYPICSCIEKDQIISLLYKFADYLQIKHIVTNKTLFSSENSGGQ